MVWLRWHKHWLIVLASLTLPSVSWGGESVPAGYRAIAAERGIPQSVLYAVALTESGKRVAPADRYRPWPWTLNVAGRGYFFESRQAAWQALLAHLEGWQTLHRYRPDAGQLALPPETARDTLAGARSLSQSACRCGDLAGLLPHPAGLVGQCGLLPRTNEFTSGRPVPASRCLSLAADRE